MYLLRYGLTMVKNRENPDSSSGHASRDPLGLKAMDAAIAALRNESARRSAEPDDTWRSLVAQLEAAHGAMALKMDLLRDRYGLLKQTSAQLADEVAWLRDQLDDLASADEVAPKPGIAPKQRSGAEAGQAQRAERRYTDRWKGRRP
jgi:hypothetical protein